jgi:hypothetical protein
VQDAELGAARHEHAGSVQHTSTLLLGRHTLRLQIAKKSGADSGISTMPARPTCIHP